MGGRERFLENLGGLTLFEKFYQGKKVFLTGHTGFKGAWLCKLLVSAGALVTGYALEPPTLSLFRLANIEKQITHSVYGDIRNLETLSAAMQIAQPEIVIHLAAQPLVRASYDHPVETYETNVMGTVNLLESVRSCNSVRSVLNVTTDKVYKNKNWEWGYREQDELDGYDPYSNSKSCSELVTNCYKRSFWEDQSVAVSTARAGNVIGGGDFSVDRIVPDCVRAATEGKDIVVRNPDSVRPYQHVLEALNAYLLIAKRQYEDAAYAGNYNIGPGDQDCCRTEDLVRMLCEAWGKNVKWVCKSERFAPHEEKILKLDCGRLKDAFGWQPRWDIATAIKKTVEWSKCWASGGDINSCMDLQIQSFFDLM